MFTAVDAAAASGQGQVLASTMPRVQNRAAIMKTIHFAHLGILFIYDLTVLYMAIACHLKRKGFNDLVLPFISLRAILSWWSTRSIVNNTFILFEKDPSPTSYVSSRHQYRSNLID